MLNPEIAFTFTSALIASITICLLPRVDNITLQKGMSVQVVETMQDLAYAVAQQACFVRLEKTLVLWCDKVTDFQPLNLKYELSSVDIPILLDEVERDSGPRPAMLYGPIYTGLAFSINCCLTGLLFRSLWKECLYDGNYQRMVLMAVAPFQFAVCMFLCDNGIAPVRLTSDLPHVTIVMPLVDATEATRRRDFYERHNCAWVARHPDNRAGRFKKSSNLNVMKGLSLEIEELMDSRRPTEAKDLRTWEAHNEESLYLDCFHEAVASTEGRVWAEGDIRIGDYILIVDSDTRIPTDSFLDAVSEMEQSPEVAILQQCSGTFLAGAGYFESGIAFFTQIVNFSISWTVANGNSAPFVGHNAFLRWSALQHQSFIDPTDNKRKIWSESHVSEDFVMTTNLVSKGYITRWATYTNHEFLEGVSLSCVDELNRWQKYAWGCSEMVFNPLRYWFTRSPFSPLYRTFLRGPAPLAFKLSCTSYISSYWALAVGPVLCLSLYPVQGLFWQLHVFLALMAHMFSYDMRWSTTIKDIQVTTVFQEVPKVLKHFKYTYALMGSFIVGVAIASSKLIPQEWRITDFAVMFPPLWTATAHILFPILLNPDITLFRY
ncbi:hypothetical protein RQP46_009318 [Phenoliferia psychrophenolica]